MSTPHALRPVAPDLIRASRLQLNSLRAYYFFSYGALGGLFPYLPLLFSQRGLDARQISWAMTLIPLGNLLVPSLWGMVADALHARIPLLRIAAVGCAATALLLWPGWGFAGAMVAMGALSLFRAPITSLIDAACVDALGGGRANFSEVRVWGSIGFAVYAFGLGQLGGSLNPAVLIAVTAGSYLVSALVTWPLRAPPLTREPHILADSLAVVRKSQVLLFLVGNAVYYLGHACYDAYFSLHARQHGLGDAAVGAAWGIGVSVEIGVMLLAPRFIHVYRPGRLLTLSALVAVVRWLATALIDDGQLLVLVQGLHGLTFGLWYLALVAFVQVRAPSRLRTSLQSITLSSLAVGGVAGYLVGGQVLHLAGGRVLYCLSAVAAAVAALLYLLATRSAARDERPVAGA
ncbi:MAG: MFS transporter [Pseudomonadota bacterium]